MELKVTAELKTVWKQTLAQLGGATLLDEDRFLAEDYEICYVSGGRDLLKTGGENSSRKMEIWANPDSGKAAVGAATAKRQRVQRGPGANTLAQ